MDKNARNLQLKMFDSQERINNDHFEHHPRHHELPHPGLPGLDPRLGKTSNEEKNLIVNSFIKVKRKNFKQKNYWE